MLEALSTHPVLIASLRIDPGNDFTVGELRMLVHEPSEGSQEGEFECEVLLLRMMAASGWMEGPKAPRQEIGGQAALRKQPDGTFIANGTFVAALEIIQQPMDLAVSSEGQLGERGTETTKVVSTSFRMVLHPQKNGWLGSVTPRRGAFDISVRFSLKTEGEEGEEITDFQEIAARGSARLYPLSLPALDASGRKRGEYYLPLIPIVLSGSRQPEGAVENFKKLVGHAHDLWSQACGVLIEPQGVRTLEVTQDVLDDLRAGRQGTLQVALTRKLRGKFTAVPIVLIEGYSSGWTLPAGKTPLWTYTLLAAEPGLNRYLLAHEVGHILGGLDDGETVTPGNWGESPNEQNVMRATSETLTENPAHIGEQGRVFAPRWSLFRELPVGPVERVRRFFDRLFFAD